MTVADTGSGKIRLTGIKQRTLSISQEKREQVTQRTISEGITVYLKVVRASRIKLVL